MKKGFRTYFDAMAEACTEVIRSEEERKRAIALKEPIYTEYEQFFPGEVDDLAHMEQYKIFWRTRIVSCPAWRSDRVNTDKPFCHAMAILVHQDWDGALIHCPECSYFGELFTAYADDARSRA